MRLFRSARLLLLALLVSLGPASSYAGIFISVGFGPPALPVYVQPPCPSPDLIWTPGYWHYGPMGYYWVPGAWVPAPFVGGLWTPGYWGWGGGMYAFHPGYWGYHVGYYGGVNYGGGYLGIGFAGGEWRGGHMAYNSAVVNVNNTVIHNTYVNQTIIKQSTVENPNHVAYAGGPGGIQHTATPQEQIAAHETHTAPTSFQTQHETTAQQDKTSWAKNNGGKPANLAVAKPLPVETKPAPARTTTPTNSMAGKTTPAAGNKATTPAANHTPEANTAGRTTTVPNKTPATTTGTTHTPEVTHNTAVPNRTVAPPKPATVPRSQPKPSPAPTRQKPQPHEK